jgi:hypothetical protein
MYFVHFVQKIRKPILVMGVVAMASLFTFGATTNQAHAAAKDTPADLNYAISTINAQLTQTVQSIQMLNGDYYTQAVDDYNSNIVDPVNQWLYNLAIEAQQNIALNSNPADWNLITSAMTESYNLNAWASAVANPTSISSGSGANPTSISSGSGINTPLDVHDNWASLTNALGNYTSDCLQQIGILQGLQSGLSPLGQPASIWQCQQKPPVSWFPW